MTQFFAENPGLYEAIKFDKIENDHERKTEGEASKKGYLNV